MLDQLVERIVKRLLIRETTKRHILQADMHTDDDDLFLEAKIVRIKEVDRLFLDSILNGDNSEKQKWLNRAHSYGVEIELELFDTGEPWLCYEQVAKSQYPIFTKEGKKLYHVSNPVICYRDVALLEAGTNLCKYKAQQITALAREQLEKKQIEVRERM